MPAEEPSSKQETLTQCWGNVGPPSAPLDQHCPSIGSMSRVCWELEPGVFLTFFLGFMLTDRGQVRVYLTLLWSLWGRKASLGIQILVRAYLTLPVTERTRGAGSTAAGITAVPWCPAASTLLLIPADLSLVSGLQTDVREDVGICQDKHGFTPGYQWSHHGGCGCAHLPRPGPGRQYRGGRLWSRVNLPSVRQDGIPLPSRGQTSRVAEPRAAQKTGRSSERPGEAHQRRAEGEIRGVHPSPQIGAVET